MFGLRQQIPVVGRGRGAIAGALLAGLALLGGCGGQDRTYAPPPPQTTAGTTTVAPIGRPAGPLSTTGAGALLMTMGADDVRQAIGEPDARSARGGMQVWRYRVRGGTFDVYFDRRGLAATYVTDAPSLATERDGIRVGDQWRPWYSKLARALARSKSGDRPRSPGGDGTWVLSAAEPGGYPALTFVVRGGRVRQIQGGYELPRSG